MVRMFRGRVLHPARLSIWNRRQTLESSCHRQREESCTVVSRATTNQNARLLPITTTTTTTTKPTRTALLWPLRNNQRSLVVTGMILLTIGIILQERSIGRIHASNAASTQSTIEEPRTRDVGISSSSSAIVREYYSSRQRRDLLVAGGSVQAKPSSIAPETTTNHEFPVMIILVLSAAINLKQRDAIRETWGTNRKNQLQDHYHPTYTVRFVVGIGSASSPWYSRNNNPNQLLTLEAESSLHGDLLVVPVEETYENLPRKLHEAIQWVIRQYGGDTIQWIVKADDDMFLRPNALYERFLTTLNPHIPLVAGCILQDEPVRNYGKWNERTFQGPIYPTFPQGSCGYVMTRPIASYIAKQRVTYYHGEDTSLGIWLSSWHDETKHSNDHNDGGDDHDNDELIQWIHAPLHFVNDGKCDQTNSNAFIIGHKITPEHMKQCFVEYKFKDFISQDHSTSFDEVERITYIRVGSTTTTTSGTANAHGDALPPNNSKSKKHSEEYQIAIARYNQNQRVTARELEEQQRRAERERRRRESIEAE